MLFGTEAFEIQVLNFIQDVFGCSFMDFFMYIFSVVGNGGMLWIVTALCLICTKKYRKSGILILLCLLAGLLIGNLAIKPLIQRPRPCWIEPKKLLMIPNPTDFSYPSGHTLSSFISAFILLKTDKRLGISALVVAGLIAFSRLYLFVHFPTDVLSGILLAWLISLPAVKSLKK